MNHPRTSNSEIGRRFWIVWALCYAMMLAIIGVGWLANPTSEGATAGLAEPGQSVPPRIGFVLFIAIVPLILAAFRLAKIRDRGAPSRVVIPVLLALLFAAAGWFDSFFPDAMGCAGFNLERFGDPDPECVTAAETRLLALAEMTLGWLLFAVAVIVAHRLQRRREARTS